MYYLKLKKQKEKKKTNRKKTPQSIPNWRTHWSPCPKHLIWFSP